MKILHLLFDDYPYIENWGYQENKFAKYQLENHDVTIIAGKYIPNVLNGFFDVHNLKKYEESEIQGHALKIYRLDCLFGNSLVGKKTKYYLNLKKTLLAEAPDFIFVHDLHALSLVTLNRYLKAFHTQCKADVHVNYANSCKNLLSYCLHRFFYRYIIKSNISRISKIYYLNENSKQFIENMYGLQPERDNLCFLPLGGDIPDINEKKSRQMVFKKEHKLPSDSVIFVHSGKMNSMKKTLEVLDAFTEVEDEKMCLLLIGAPSEEIQDLFYEKIKKDHRVHYLGWKTNEELMDYLMVCDVYLQPGTPSVTAHEALCKGCAVILSQEGDFYRQFIDENCVIYLSGERDLKSVLTRIKDTPELIIKYKNNGFDLAKKIFDYRAQSELILR